MAWTGLYEADMPIAATRTLGLDGEGSRNFGFRPILNTIAEQGHLENVAPSGSCDWHNGYSCRLTLLWEVCRCGVTPHFVRTPRNTPLLRPQIVPTLYPVWAGSSSSFRDSDRGTYSAEGATTSAYVLLTI